jgi:hypothetical protein
MTPEQQRIKIAEARGWTEIEPCTCHGHQSRGYEPTKGAYKKHLPDYLNDLNAMHEAEISYIITNGLWDDYVTHLRNLMQDGERFWGQATAKQRAEAFLRTITPMNA